ncbi:MAG TPA: nucleoside triphosphate pyrophosphohydrolase [Candidatus Polarisedimenticolia bacterium]|nr:nucleoside triphosphate pyrophosphohydrolase [Candidatus Polarisedimenticolia bacterium]
MSEAVRLRDIMDRLRGPSGCPWDREQTPETLRTFLIEEAYEVIDAIDRGRPGDLKEELGDLLFQIVFLSRVAEERGWFDLDAVMRGIGDKIVRRHPHVFGADRLDTSAEVLRQWEEIKSDERRGRGEDSMFAGVPQGLPALLKALRISAKAARVGFDWPDGASLWSKVEEEMKELDEARRRGAPDQVAEEIGDLLFTLANVARQEDLDPEQILQEANRKFLERFRYVEEGLRRDGLAPAPEHRARMEELWTEAKTRLRRTSPDRTAPSGGTSGSAPRPDPTPGAR